MRLCGSTSWDTRRSPHLGAPASRTFPRAQAPSLESSCLDGSLSRPPLNSENGSDVCLLNRLEEYSHLSNSSMHFPVCSVQFGHEFPTRCIGDGFAFRRELIPGALTFGRRQASELVHLLLKRLCSRRPGTEFPSFFIQKG